MSTVYSDTTVPDRRSSFFMVDSEHLDRTRFFLKIAEVILSFIAFVLEESIGSCFHCNALYFFEFVSCTAFLFTFLLLILLSTNLYSKVGISCWPTVDFSYTGIIAVLLLIASIVFVAENSRTNLESLAVAFGFFATLAFVVDFGLFVKNRGIPFKKDEKSESNNGQPGMVCPEEEKLAGQS
ncbi:CKLF-like MARVEL transmembrane domain-containing protein 6 [Pholidichthys leucotaenia]